MAIWIFIMTIVMSFIFVECNGTQLSASIVYSLPSLGKFRYFSLFSSVPVSYQNRIISVKRHKERECGRWKCHCCPHTYTHMYICKQQTKHSIRKCSVCSCTEAYFEIIVYKYFAIGCCKLCRIVWACVCVCWDTFYLAILCTSIFNSGHIHFFTILTY